MWDPDRQYVARRPRHEATGSPSVRVELQRARSRQPARIDARLVNLSRSGVCLAVASPLEVGEAIRLLLVDGKSGLRFARSATVRWQRAEQAGKWSVGCQFAQEVDWETLGELFLNNILSTKKVSGTIS